MATNLDIDQALLEKAVELSGKRSKKDAVTMALEEFVARRSQKNMLELFGKFDWQPGYDYKAERSRK